MNKQNMMKLADCLSPEDVLLGLDAADAETLFRRIGEHVEKGHSIEAGLVERSLLRREGIGSTGLGRGFAIPHARLADLDRAYAIYVRLNQPIKFHAPDDKSVDNFLVLLVPAPATEAHLVLLAEASQLFATRRGREYLQSARSGEEVIGLLRQPVDVPGAGTLHR